MGIQRANMPSRLLICASVLAVLLCHTVVSAEVTPSTIVPERGLDSLKSQILGSDAHEVPAAALSSDVVNKATGDEDTASGSEDELWSIGGMAKKAKDKANELKDKAVRKAEEAKDEAVRKAEEKADEDTGDEATGDEDTASGSEDELLSTDPTAPFSGCAPLTGHCAGGIGVCTTLRGKDFWTNPGGGHYCQSSSCSFPISCSKTDTPTASPTANPTASPSDTPTAAPSDTRTAAPSDTSTAAPSDTPTAAPSVEHMRRRRRRKAEEEEEEDN